MKYLFALWLAILFAVSDVVSYSTAVASAEPSPFDGRHKIEKPVVYMECHYSPKHEQGFLFIIAASHNSVAIMQVFQDAGGMVPKPVECEVEDD